VSVDQVEACKAHFLQREREILDRCSKEVAKAEIEAGKAKQLRERLEQLLCHMQYDGLTRTMHIRDDDLALLGFRFDRQTGVLVV